MINIIEDFIPKGRRSRPGLANPMNFITIHNTGNSNRSSNARAHANYLRGDTAAGLPVSWHYTVDDGIVIQHLPDNETAFHAGDGSGPGNRQSIGIEICQNADGNLLLATNNAAMLCAILCTRHNIATKNIVQHNFWSGKNCPQELRANRPYSWTTFLSKVDDYVKELYVIPPELPRPPAPDERTPEEIIVDNAFELGILGDRAYWLGVIRGTITPRPEFIKGLLSNAVGIVESYKQ